jgi:hypothetical protein
LALALPLLEEALRLRKARLGADHPDTLTSMHNLGTGYWAAGKPELALQFFQAAAVGVEKRRFRHEHANLIVNNLIGCHELLKQFDHAEPWRRKWLAVVRERSGAQSAPYADELAALGGNLLHQQKWADAESVLRDCLAIRGQFQPDAWTTFSTQAMLGGALLGQKKHADAAPLLLKGYAGMKRRAATIPPQGKLLLTDAVQWLIGLYEATGNQDEAARWRTELGKVQVPWR